MEVVFSLAVALIGGIGYLLIPPQYPDAKILLKEMFKFGGLVFCYQIGLSQLHPFGK